MILASALQKIHDADGFAIAVTGILIVFVALVLISGFLTALPRLLELLNRYFPEPVSHSPSPATTQADAATDEVVAAIAVALHTHRKQ